MAGARLCRRDGATCIEPRIAAPTCAPSCRRRAVGHRPRHGLQHRSAVLDRDCADPRRALIARYAWGDDYHDVIRAAHGCARRVDARAQRPSRSRRAPTSIPGRCRSACTRSMPGLGWIGSNTCVINAELGSWLFLSEIICSLPLEPDRAGARPVRLLPAVPRRVPDGRARRATGPRRDTLPVVSDHRGARRDSRRGTATPLARTPTAATSVRKSVPGTCSRLSTRHRIRRGCLVSRSIGRRWRRCGGRRTLSSAAR